MLVNKETLLKVQTKKVKKEDQVRYEKINKDVLEISELIKDIDNIDNKGDKMELKGIISYGLNYVQNESTAYKQCLRIDINTFKLIKEAIKEKLLKGLDYGDYLELPIVYKNKNICFGGLNLSTARFVKNLMDDKTQKRFLMDRNTFLVVDLK